MLAFTVQDAMVKSLSEDYAVLQLLVARGIFVLLILVPLALYLLGTRGLKMKRPWLMVARGALSFFAFTSYYIALTVIPLADGAALFMSAPLFVTAMSMFILKEKVGIHRWTAVVIGFSMVLYILNPGSELFQLIAALPLFSALCYAVIPILTRMIGTSEHVVTMTIYLKTTYLVLCLIMLGIIHFGGFYNSEGVFFTSITLPWKPFDLTDSTMISLAGVIFTIALLFITQAYRIAVVSAVAPFEYSLIFWAGLIGFLAFGDVPSERLIIGSIVIISCGIYISHREARLAAG
ncbi:MAG: drug/metabolite transporter (DMT)-like permease [Parasphingorhabdus sp.]|jgi:drug/metabolite transporter (DMT)-like permease